MLDSAKLQKFVDQSWGDEIVPTLVEYIKIPNKSPLFDPDWAAHGHMDQAVAMFERWAREKIVALPGATLEVIRLEGRTPLILIEIPGSGSKASDDTVLLYGHLDKQPEMVGWEEGYGPWAPRIVGDKLYGRGGADDGYAMFGALSALLALREQGAAHARALVLIEACEESGSADLPAHLAALGDSLGEPSLVVCLDAECGRVSNVVGPAPVAPGDHARYTGKGVGEPALRPARREPSPSFRLGHDVDCARGARRVVHPADRALGNAVAALDPPFDALIKLGQAVVDADRAQAAVVLE